MRRFKRQKKKRFKRQNWCSTFMKWTPERDLPRQPLAAELWLEMFELANVRTCRCFYLYSKLKYQNVKEFTTNLVIF